MDLADAFLYAETNNRLSGRDPSHDPHYMSLKKRLLEGTLTEQQAIKEIQDFYLVDRTVNKA